MLIEDARNVEAAARALLGRINEGSASCAQMREALPVLKSTAAMISAAQRSAAASIAGRERHGDGGAEMLAEAAGLSRGEARSHIKTAQTLRDLPAVRDAVESGLVSHANAKQLAAAADKAGSSAVASDSELLAKAQTLRPEQFAREARRWVTSRDRDDGAAEHARQRARRKLRVWSADDGMTRLYGEFDAITGTRIANRLRACASDMYAADKKDASNDNASKSGGRGGGRSFDQCMADALEQLTNNDNNSGGGKPVADICIVAHVDQATGKLIAELPDRTKLPDAVLEELACTAKLTGVIYDRQGKAIWRAHSVRCATDAQRQLLTARDGGCFGCDAHPGVCDAHHVTPVSQGGTTKLDNLVLACWRCHHKIHHHRWQIHGPPAHRTLHPPGTPAYGPAHAPEEPSLPGPSPGPQEPAPLDPRPSTDKAKPPHSRHNSEAASLFDPEPGPKEPAVAHSGPDFNQAESNGCGRDTSKPERFDPEPEATARTEPQHTAPALAATDSDRGHPTGPAPPRPDPDPAWLLESADARGQPKTPHTARATASERR